jgi:hypothetical protein
MDVGMKEAEIGPALGTGDVTQMVEHLPSIWKALALIPRSGLPPKKIHKYLLAIMALIGFSSYCTLKLLFSRVTVLPQV